MKLTHISLVLIGCVVLAAVVHGDNLAEEDHLHFADGLFARGMHELAAKEYRGFLEAYPDSKAADVAYFRLGECYRHLEAYPEAEKAYRTVFNAYPDSEYRHAAGCKRADLFIETGQYTAAIELFDVVLGENPPEEIVASCHYFKGEAYLKSDDTESAVAEFQRVADAYPDSRFGAYALLKLGTIWARDKGDAEKGLAFYVQAADRAATDRVKAEALFQMADLYYRQEDYERSAEYYRQLLSDYPEDERAMEAGFQAGWASYRSGFYAEALKRADEALARETSDADAGGADEEAASEWLYLKANCERQLLQHAAAAATYARLIHEYPDSLFTSAARYEQAVALFKMGEYERAVAEASELRAKGALGKDIFWLLAESYAALERREEAIQYYRLVIRNYGDSDVARDAHYRLGHQLQSVGNNTEAVRQYQLVAETFPEDELAPQALFAAALCQLRDETYAEAARDLQLLIERYPESPLREEALYQQAMCEIRLGRNSGALAVLRRLLAEFPESSFAGEAHYWQGMLLLETDKAEDAEQALRTALQGTPRDEIRRTAEFYLAVALHKQGKHDAALEGFIPLMSTPARDRFSPDLLVWIAESLLDKKRYEPASQAASLLLEAGTEPRWQQIGWGLRGQSEAAMGNQPLAQDAFRKVLECDAQTRFAGIAALRLGEMAYDADDAARAEEYFNRAAALADDASLLGVRAKAYAGLGRAAEARGDQESAARYFMSVAVLYDDPVLVPACLARAAESFNELGREDAAARVVAELLERYPDSAEARQAAASGE